MLFKQDWEKTETLVVVSLGIIEGMVKQAYPQKNLTSHKIISGGCANLNIKINFEGESHPYLLRIYLHIDVAQLRKPEDLLLFIQQCLDHKNLKKNLNSQTI